ncbi:MAG TPA: chromate efflux transporter [Alcaligenes sp.]|nr:chromate efflux transporter [Alcaligenes sp.]HRL28242.1 chromate efflux transporter [Alcaligenes sp.]
MTELLGYKVSNWQRALEVFWVFLRLGCTSFGGPLAHLAFFRQDLVQRRQWLDDKSYTDLLALCQFLPGPTSSQVGMGIGLRRAGLVGALAAWVGFTLPSAVLMIGLAWGLDSASERVPTGLIHGMKIVAVAVVAQALWGMGRSLCPDRSRLTLAVCAALLALAVPGAWGQWLVIVMGATAGGLLFSADPQPAVQDQRQPTGRWGWVAGAVFLLLLLMPMWLASGQGAQAWSLFDAFYRSGSLVFGGGHVVLPLLQSELVGPGWVDEQTFLAGYGMAQAMPGPLFSVAGFLGASASVGPGGVAGGLLGLLAIFLPALLLVLAVWPYWERLSRASWAQALLKGVNAAVVGLLLAAFYDPVWSSAIGGTTDFSLALIAFIALTQWRVPPWLAVLGAGVFGWYFL